MAAPAKVASLKAVREAKQRQRYADLVLQKWDELREDDRHEAHRAVVEKKTVAHFAAKTRF